MQTINQLTSFCLESLIDVLESSTLSHKHITCRSIIEGWLKLENKCVICGSAPSEFAGHNDLGKVCWNCYGGYGLFRCKKCDTIIFNENHSYSGVKKHFLIKHHCGELSH